MEEQPGLGLLPITHERSKGSRLPEEPNSEVVLSKSKCLQMSTSQPLDCMDVRLPW